MGDFQDYLKNKYGSDGAQQESDYSVYTFKKKKKRKKKKKKEKRQKVIARRPNIEVDSISASAWGRPKQADEDIKLVQPKLIDQKKSNVKAFIPKVADGSGWKVVTTNQPKEAEDESDSDQDVAPRRRHDSSDSDQEVARVRHDSDSDQEIARKRHDSDSDQEMPRRDGSDDSDQEVPRTRIRHDSDSDPEPTETAANPPALEESEEDSDQDIPRRGRQDDSDSDQEIPRPGSKRKIEQSVGAPDAKRRADAKKIIHRDKNGKIIKMSEREMREKEWEDRHNLEWGSGIKQKFDREDAALDYAKSKTETLARYEDDFEMNQMLEEKGRWGDPLAEFDSKATKKKKKKKKKEKKLQERPRFQGKACFNRFGILPGYRWDGIDRGNGWEVVRNKKMAEMGRNVTRDYMAERSNW